MCSLYVYFYECKFDACFPELYLVRGSEGRLATDRKSVFWEKCLTAQVSCVLTQSDKRDGMRGASMTARDIRPEFTTQRPGMYQPPHQRDSGQGPDPKAAKAADPKAAKAPDPKAAKGPDPNSATRWGTQAA